MVEPTSTRVFNLLDKTSGRDRLCRTVQYGAKLVAWLMEQNVDKSVLQRVKRLESSISTARKLFRIGKSFHHFHVALKTIHLHNPIQQVLVTLARINRGLYLLMDHIVWVGKVKLLDVDTGKWSRTAARFWLFAVIFGLHRDLYELWIALRVERTRLRHDTTGGSQTLSTALRRTLHNNPAITVDMVKNATDIFLPLQSLEYINLPGGIIGLLGVVSSLCGLASIWEDTLKLKYS